MELNEALSQIGNRSNCSLSSKNHQRRSLFQQCNTLMSAGRSRNVTGSPFNGRQVMYTPYYSISPFIERHSTSKWPYSAYRPSCRRIIEFPFFLNILLRGIIIGSMVPYTRMRCPQRVCASLTFFIVVHGTSFQINIVTVLATMPCKCNQHMQTYQGRRRRRTSTLGGESQH